LGVEVGVSVSSGTNEGYIEMRIARPCGKAFKYILFFILCYYKARDRKVVLERQINGNIEELESFKVGVLCGLWMTESSNCM